jgi:hypothetical protein
MFTNARRIFPLFIVGVLLLAACNLPAGSAPATLDPNLIHTAAAETVVARLTEAASGQSTPVPAATSEPGSQQPVQTATDVPAQPTATTAPATQAPATQAPLPTATQAPPTPTPIPCDRASFVTAGETYKDGTELAPGTTFVKTWRLKNTGSCTWNSAYSLVFISGDAMGAPASVQLTTGTVAPGQEVDVSVTMKAPDTPKEYTGNWKLRNSAGTIFGIGTNAQSAFWVKIKVVSPVTPTPTVSPTPAAVVMYNFMDKAPSAEWRNASQALPWGDPGPDDDGVADFSENARLNDGKTYPKVLATFPEQITDGVITGLFSHYNIQSGDHFRALVGFRANCDKDARVKFQLNYVEAGMAPVSIREWTKSCDSNLLSLDVDLSSLAGKSVQFMLAVTTDGAAQSEKTVWVNPRIER